MGEAKEIALEVLERLGIHPDAELTNAQIATLVRNRVEGLVPEWSPGFPQLPEPPTEGDFHRLGYVRLRNLTGEPGRPAIEETMGEVTWERDSNAPPGVGHFYLDFYPISQTTTPQGAPVRNTTKLQLRAENGVVRAFGRADRLAPWILPSTGWESAGFVPFPAKT